MKYIRKDKYTKPHTPTDILKLALEKEKSSYQFYLEMSQETDSDILKRVLAKLKNAEWGHIQIIKGKLGQ